MKIIRNNIIPPPGFKAINILGILFVRKNALIGSITINHESIHTRQGRELLWIGFYLLYLIEWLFRLIQVFVVLKKFSSHLAYRRISFEREAYENQDNMEYNKSRKRFSFIKYL